MGEDFIWHSGLGDELNYVPVDKHTMQSTSYDNIFAIGDAADIPTSKAGSVAHFAVDVLVDNLVKHVHGRPMLRSFDGHADCFIESGYRKGMLIDFNYDTEPLPGKYPLPGIGPFPSSTSTIDRSMSTRKGSSRTSTSGTRTSPRPSLRRSASN